MSFGDNDERSYNINKVLFAKGLGHAGWHFHMHARGVLWGAGQRVLWEWRAASPGVLLFWDREARLFG